MIEISGSIRRSFFFPAELELTFQFFTDLPHRLNLLPHISVLQRYAEDRYRLLYRTTEGALYPVSITCDLQAVLQSHPLALLIQPLEGIPPVYPSAGLYAIHGQGYFSSQSMFFAEAAGTRVEYMLALHARLPVPHALRLVPKQILDRLANDISHRRIREIGEGFIQRSIQAYQ